MKNIFSFFWWIYKKFWLQIGYTKTKSTDERRLLVEFIENRIKIIRHEIVIMPHDLRDASDILNVIIFCFEIQDFFHIVRKYKDIRIIGNWRWIFKCNICWKRKYKKEYIFSNSDHINKNNRSIFDVNYRI